MRVLVPEHGLPDGVLPLLQLLSARFMRVLVPEHGFPDGVLPLLQLLSARLRRSSFLTMTMLERDWPETEVPVDFLEPADLEVPTDMFSRDSTETDFLETE